MKKINIIQCKLITYAGIAHWVEQVTHMSHGSGPMEMSAMLSYLKSLEPPSLYFAMKMANWCRNLGENHPMNASAPLHVVLFMNTFTALVV